MPATAASRSRAGRTATTCTGSPTGSSRGGPSAPTASAGSRAGRHPPCYTLGMAERDAVELYGDRHVKSYRETGGEYGHLWRGAPTLLLTTTGSRSGEPRTMALIYGRSGDDYLLVASKGGASDYPSWFKNLRKHPDVELQVRDEVFRARAREATDEEKPAMWRGEVGARSGFDPLPGKEGPAHPPGGPGG